VLEWRPLQRMRGRCWCLSLHSLMQIEYEYHQLPALWSFSWLPLPPYAHLCTDAPLPICLDLNLSLSLSLSVFLTSFPSLSREKTPIEYEIHSARPSSGKPPSALGYHQSVAVWGFPFHVAELALFADESRRLSLDLAARRETRRQERLTVWPTILPSRTNLFFDFPRVLRDRRPWTLCFSNDKRSSFVVKQIANKCHYVAGVANSGPNELPRSISALVSRASRSRGHDGANARDV